jgi:hypothetical protein
MAKPQRFLQLLFVILVISRLSADSLSIRSAIPLPAGYTRYVCPANSFGAWLGSQHVKSDHCIRTFTGNCMPQDYFNTYAVLDMPLLFKADLEQCADFAMRLWAEYFKQTGHLEQLTLFDYNGHVKRFANAGQSYAAFLKQAFSTTNSYSLKKGCADVPPDSLIPGDLLVQNSDGGIGHVSVIVDVALSGSHQKIYLIGFSFMPAQEFHIEKAPTEFGIDGWFTLKGYLYYLDTYMPYGKPVYRRFR